MPDAVASARRAVFAQFRWNEGHADVWGLTEDADTFNVVIEGLASLAGDLRPTAIAGIETRGVLFGAPVAHHLGLGFHTIRKTDGLFAGAAHSALSAPDYRGRSYTMRIRGSVTAGDRVVLVDDWIEKGSQASAARDLVKTAGASLAGIVTVVDESDGRLGARSLVRASELPDWAGE
jgi:adenine phosphoribosyltransferase